MSIETIGLGLDSEQRGDNALRAIFVTAFELASAHLDDAGNWRSMADELMAHEVLKQNFPELTGLQLLATLATIASVRASGRTPVL
ncbi:hypothetical protein MASR1M60_18320 [Rhodocyclaceae bacterium]